MFAVVVFSDTHEVEVVPCSWILETTSTQDIPCYWPALKNKELKRVLQDPAKPNMAICAWQKYRVRILKTYETYEKAIMKLDKAREFSDLSSSDVEGFSQRKRRIQAPMRYQSSDEEEAPPLKRISKKQNCPPLPRVPSPPVQTPRTPTFTPQVSQSTPESCYLSSQMQTPRARALSPSVTPPESCYPSPQVQTPRTPTFTPQVSQSMPGSCYPSSQIQTPRARVSSPPVTPPESRCLKTDEWIVNRLELILGQVRQNTLLLRSLSNGKAAEDMDLDVDIFGFPLKTQQDVDKVETLLKDKSKLKTLVTHLKSLGGSNIDDMVKRCMSSVFSNALATIYNWKGRGSKFPFSDLILSKAVIAACRKQGHSEASTEERIKAWLRYSTDREGGRNKRRQNKEQHVWKATDVEDLLSSEEN